MTFHVDDGKLLEHYKTSGLRLKTWKYWIKFISKKSTIVLTIWWEEKIWNLKIF